MGQQIRIDDGGTTAANETSIASSNFNRNEIVAAWNDWRESTPSRDLIRVGVAVSNDGGATWSDFLVRPPQEPQDYRSDIEGDPMTAYDDRTGTLWVGGISFAYPSYGLIFVARKIPGQAAFYAPVMAQTTSGADKALMAAGPAPGNPNATNLYIAYSATGFTGSVIRSEDWGEQWSEPVALGTGFGLLPRVGPNGEL